MKLAIYRITFSFLLLMTVIATPKLSLGAELGLNEYVENAWTTPDKSITGKKLIVILSGYNDSIEKCHEIAKFFGPNFDATFGFEYSSYIGIDENAQILKNELKELAENNRIFIIAHSMGGLVARYALEQLGLGEKVHYLLMLATPNEGIPGNDLAGVFVMGAKAFKLPTESLAQLFAGGEFLKNLNAGVSDYSETSHYYAIQGTKHKGIFPEDMQPFKPVVHLLLHAFNTKRNDGLIPYYSDETSSLKRKSSSWEGHINVNMGHFELKYRLEEMNDTYSKIMDRFDSKS